jgi:hypothetical protein
MNKASCLSLLSNAVLVWNTVRISEIVERLRAAGEQILDTDLARVSPLCYAHIIPNGTYNFEGAIHCWTPPLMSSRMRDAMRAGQLSSSPTMRPNVAETKPPSCGH